MAQPRPIPPRRPGIAAWVLLAAVCAAVVAADLALDLRSGDLNLGGNTTGSPPTLPARQQHYNLLVRGLEQGHLYLDKEVPPGLARLPDPYNPTANAIYRFPNGLHDLTYYGGHLYLYFGITPALTAFLPWHLLTGTYLSEALVVAGFSAAGFLLSAVFVVSLWRRAFPEVAAGYVAAGLLILGFGTTIPLLDARPNFWEVPISSAYAFLMLAVACGWFGCRRARARAVWPALAGLAAGLAVGARPNVLPSALCLTAAAALGAALADPDPRKSRRSALARSLAAAFLPLVAVGVGLALYNRGRFGDPLQFGQHYQLSTDDVHGRSTFSVAFLPDNIRLYGLSALRWSRSFPFAWTPALVNLAPGHGDVEFVVGILPNLPVLLLALASPLALRGRTRPEGRLLGGVGAGLAIPFVIQAAILGLFYGICSRYEVDFLPFLALLACLGLFGLARVLAPASGRVRRAFAAAFGIVCAYSCVTVGCAAVAWNQFNRINDLALLLVNGGHPAEAVPLYREEVRITHATRDLAELADTELKAGQTGAAIATYREGLRLKPRDWNLHANLGVAFVVAGDLESALGELRESDRIEPGCPSTDYALGVTLLRLGRPGEAAACLEDAVRQDPNNGTTRRTLGHAYQRAGRAADAVGELRVALDLSPDDPGLQDEFGMALLQAGLGNEAIGHFQAALRLNPSFAQARDHLSLAQAQGH